MRIVAGTAKGRTLAAPKPTSRHIRPTADRVRETLFNILGQRLDGELVLDLYAGTGALGLEAISRGASRAVLVDQDREALSLCRRNTEHLGFTDCVEVLAQPVERAVETLGKKGEKFDLIFADPPYAARMVEAVLEQVARAGLLSPGGTVVIEHDKREQAPESHEGFARVDERRFGDTVASFFRIP